MSTQLKRFQSVSRAYVGVVNREYWRIRPHASPYFHLLDRVHQYLLPRTYLEIGVESGTSMTLSFPGALNIGVDPEPKVAMPLTRTTTIFAETSDEFFAGRELGALLAGQPLDLVFIDGMHHFEFALRDFMNIERNAAPETTVLVHDCYPIDESSADRVQPPGPWSGDVWKLIVLLKERRPELRISVVDVGPTGLGVITGLQPDSTVLEDSYEEIESTYSRLSYSYLEDGDKATLLNLVPNEWATVQSLLPSGPLRHEALPLLVSHRAALAGWSVVRSKARRQRLKIQKWTRPKQH
jgi:Methyltransferase domain